MINEGAFLVTFFGHSSAITFDLNIYDISKYEETDFYPMSLALGCYSGNYHLPSLSGAENLSFVPNKGFLGMIANSGAAFPGELNFFTRQFYEEIGDDMDNGFLREKLNKALNSIASNNPKIFEQMAMLGDPATLHFTAKGPDLAFEYSETKINPNIVTTETDSIDVTLKVINLGAGLETGESVDINLERVTPDGKMQTIFEGELEISSPSTEFPIRIPVQTESANIGRNLIFASMNKDEKIEEWPSDIAYSNNQLKNNIGENGYPFNVFGFDIELVYPENFSIIPTDSVVLTTQLSNSSLNAEDFIVFELDTTPRFDSGFKIQKKVSSNSGSIPQWRPEIPLKNETVYYWRASQDSTSIEKPFNWKTSSFTFIEGETGWNQSHWGQFIQDTLTRLELSDKKDELDFSYKPAYWTMRVGQRTSGGEEPYLFHDTSNPFSSVRPWNSRSSGIFVISFLSRKLGLNVNTNLGGNMGLYGSSIKGNGDHSVFSYELDSEASRDSFLMLLENHLPDDNFIFIGTIRNTHSDSISTEMLNSRGITGKSIVETLKERGSVMIDSLAKTGKENFGIIYNNENLELIDEGLSKDDYVYTYLTTRDYVQSGELKTPAIRPVKKWDKIQWKHKEAAGTQKVRMSVDLADNTQQQNIINLTDVDTYEQELTENEIELNHKLSITYNPIDSTDRVLSPIEKMKVNYVPLPDLILSSVAGTQTIDSVESGQFLDLTFVPVVYSTEVFEDSVDIRIRLSNTQGVVRDITEKILLTSSTSESMLNKLNTGDLSGLYNIEITINYEETIAESRYTNNSIYKSIFVLSDHINPLLDLTFDGTKILSGQLVAANPNIVIAAKDDNKFKLLDDINLFKLMLKKPGENSFSEINLLTEEFHFEPAQNSDKNEATIEWNPEFTISGDYELSINVKDVDGNSAGGQDRIVQFKVITENSISNLVNYPNPFSDRTRFVYTLTGYNVPYNYKIEIYTISGKLIREITKEELGILRVGTHLTDYEWDARDRYGNRLANGVYLYRLVILDEDLEQVKHYESQVDKYSKANFSKMVITK